jgi:flagellar hook-length control protein FliK
LATLAHQSIPGVDEKRGTLPVLSNLVESQPNKALASELLLEKGALGGGVRSVGLGFEQGESEPLRENGDTSQKLKHEAVKMSGIPTPHLAPEKPTHRHEMSEPLAAKGAVSPTKSSPLEVYIGAKMGQPQAATAPSAPSGSMDGSALQFDMLGEDSVSPSMDQGVIEDGFRPERQQGAAINAAPVEGRSHQQASVATSIGQQISAAIDHKSANVTEISLNPEELGRVRFSMKTHEGSIVLIIAAERAETQDLMRKHIDSLSHEFRSLGFTDIGFQFEGHGQSDERGKSNETMTSSDQKLELGGDIVELRHEPIAKDGLDLRL